MSFRLEDILLQQPLSWISRPSSPASGWGLLARQLSWWLTRLVCALIWAALRRRALWWQRLGISLTLLWRRLNLSPTVSQRLTPAAVFAPCSGVSTLRLASPFCPWYQCLELSSSGSLSFASKFDADSTFGQGWCKTPPSFMHIFTQVFDFTRVCICNCECKPKGSGSPGLPWWIM
jgi:hypothetical protein